MFYFPILLVLAALPVFALMFFVYINAGKRKVSMKLVIPLGVMGGISTIPAAIIEYMGGVGLARLHISEETKTIIELFLIVGVVEELGKYLPLVFSTWKHSFFKHSYSAIVYSVSASLGFALIENILYVLVGGAAVGVVRAFTAVPLHCMVAIVMGFFYAIGREAAYQKRIGKCILFMFLAYVIPVTVHGYYDYIATKAADSIVYIGMFALTVMVILTIGILLLIFAAKKNHRLDGEEDPPYLDMPNLSPYYYPPMPYGALLMYGGMQPYGMVPMHGGMQPYGMAPMHGGMQPYGMTSMYGGMQPYGMAPMHGGVPPYAGMPMQRGMPGYGYTPTAADYYAATEYGNAPMYPIYNMPLQGTMYPPYNMPQQDSMYPDYNVWQGTMLPVNPEMFYAPGKDQREEAEEKKEDNNENK